MTPRSRAAVGLSLVLVLCQCDWFAGRAIERSFSGKNFVGKGTAKLDISLGPRARVSIDHGDLTWDAIRLNELGDGGRWSLNFNDLLVVGGPPARMYVEIELKQRPVKGLVSPRKVRASCAVYAPQRFEGRRVGEEVRFRDGEVFFDQVDLRVGGALSGRFSFIDGERWVKGEFAVELVAPPPLLSGAH